MAFSNFDLRNGSFAGTNVQTIEQHGVGILATNPLLTGGTYCRRIYGENAKIYFNSSAYGGALFSVPNTKVISARAHLRLENQGYDIMLTVKDGAPFDSLEGSTGYRFGLKGGFDTRKLALWGANGTQNDQILLSDLNIGYNMWFSLRMDVFPLGTVSDRILCYMEVDNLVDKNSSPGSGVWLNIFDHTISSTNIRFAQWSNNGRNGIIGRGGGSIAAYVDNINFKVFNAPT